MDACVLVVDDDREIVRAIALLLEKEGYRTLKAYDGMEALRVLAENEVQLIIMDVMMPKLDGLSAMMKIRERKNLPIIVLSAKTEDTDKILGLSMGADDYVAKPFNPQELAARVKSQLRRYTPLGGIHGENPNDEIVNGRLCYRLKERTLYADGEPVRLTATETKIMELLMKNRGRIFPAEEIYERVWEEPSFSPENTVMVHIRHIREKIELNPKEPEYIKVVWGIGYKMEKSKMICSFMAFATGLTILVTNLVPAVSMALVFGMGIFEEKPDYQESEEFRYLISEKLSDLLGIATGGQAYSATQENVLQEQTVAEENFVEEAEAFGGNWDDYQAYLDEQQAYYEEMMADMGYGYAGEEGYIVDRDYDGYYSGYYYGYDYADQESRDRYMADMAQNKNLRYAVVYQNKLLYSNIDGFAEKAGEEWADTDFQEALDKNEYNFVLWFNRTGDGRVEITKDGLQEDVYDEVYGDGMYSQNSRWRVPGYPNYTVGESTKDAVIFLAAAKNPKLYMVREDGSSHATQYGGRQYHMQQNILYLYSVAERIKIFMSTALLLLAAALLMRKSRRQAVEGIAGFLGKICLEIKLFLLLILTVLLTGISWGVLGQLGWWIRNGFSYYQWSDYIYETARLTAAGGYLALWFWLIYLVVLDWRLNGKKQKTPVFSLLKVKDFKYPIQKRLVKRQRMTLIAEITLLLLFAGAICALWLFQGEMINWLTGGYGYNYAYDDVYEAVAADLGYPFSMRWAYMLTACVIFAALFVFTLLTAFGLKKNHRLARDIGALTDQILAVREGNLTEELVLSEDTDLREAADNLNQIQKGMERALAERMKSERMKVDLVTNVSHDIKTPLTSIVSYVELLRQEEELPSHVREYVQILGEKAERPRGIVQDVFEISKATSGQLPINMETLDMGKLLRQTMADMSDRIEESGLTLRTAIPETPVSVLADGQRLYRVFQNLLQNALCYSLAGSRVFLTLTEEDGQAVVRIKNTSGAELADGKDFTERFVRGDDSRTDGGSGLGLSIAKSFAEACGGKLTVETDADLFTVTVCFAANGIEQ